MEKNLTNKVREIFLCMSNLNAPTLQPKLVVWRQYAILTLWSFPGQVPFQLQIVTALQLTMVNSITGYGKYEKNNALFCINL